MSLELALALVNLLGLLAGALRVHLQNQKLKQQHTNLRAAHDLARRLAFKLEQADPSDPQLRHIRAKATRIGNEMCEEEGRPNTRKVPKVFVEDVKGEGSRCV